MRSVHLGESVYAHCDSDFSGPVVFTDSESLEYEVRIEGSLILALVEHIYQKALNYAYDAEISEPLSPSEVASLIRGEKVNRAQ